MHSLANIMEHNTGKAGMRQVREGDMDIRDPKDFDATVASSLGKDSNF